MQILSKTISCRNTQSIFIPIILLVQISLAQLLIGAWVDELWINQLLGAPFFSLMNEMMSQPLKNCPFFDVG